MSEGNVKIKQLKDKSGDLIAPYTPTHAVYTSTGTRLDYELGKIDVISAATDSKLSNFKTETHNEMNAFKAETTNKLNSLSATTNTALDALHQSIKTEIKEEINDLSGKTQTHINELYDTTFQIQLSMSVTPSSTNNPTSHGIAMSVTQKSKGAFIPDKLELKKSVNGGVETSVYTGKTASHTYTSNVEGNIEKFTSTATKTGRTGASTSKTRYICAYAANNSASISDALFSAAIKKSATGVGFNPSVTTTNGQYIWIFVPSTLNINTITSAGFAVTMTAAVTYTLSSGSYKGTYKAYRTANALGAATWDLVIS